jgi:hypothetical protein
MQFEMNAWQMHDTLALYMAILTSITSLCMEKVFLYAHIANHMWHRFPLWGEQAFFEKKKAEGLSIIK